MIWLVGPILGVILTLFVYPFIQEPIHDWIVSNFGGSRQKKGHRIAGTWHEIFFEDGKEPDIGAEDREAFLRQIGRSVVGSYKARGCCYYLKGKVLQSKYFTGTWYGEYAGISYCGVFQFLILPEARGMSGRWLGISGTGTVKAGLWYWKRPDEKNYFPLPPAKSLPRFFTLEVIPKPAN